MRRARTSHAIGFVGSNYSLQFKFVPICATILRHPDENLAKCTLEPLRRRSELEFFAASPGFQVDGTNMILLEVGAPVLSAADAGRRLLLLDGNWKHVEFLRSRVVGMPVARSLPTIETAYPRRNRDGLDPQVGLASVEALYLALKILGHDDPTLLADYHWRDEFFRRVAELKL